MNTSNLGITSIPSPEDISEVVKRMTLRASKNETGFEHLEFPAKECPNDRIEPQELESFKKAGYTFEDSVMESLDWVVEVHELTIQDDYGVMYIIGKVRLGNSFYLNVKVVCDLSNNIGFLSNFSFDKIPLK